MRTAPASSSTRGDGGNPPITIALRSPYQDARVEPRNQRSDKDEYFERDFEKRRKNAAANTDTRRAAHIDQPSHTATLLALTLTAKRSSGEQRMRDGYIHDLNIYSKHLNRLFCMDH